MLQILMLVISMVMFLAPKSCTKKEDRDNPEKVAKIKKSGLILTCVVIVWIAVSLIPYFMK